MPNYTLYSKGCSYAFVGVIWHYLGSSSRIFGVVRQFFVSFYCTKATRKKHWQPLSLSSSLVAYVTLGPIPSSTCTSAHRGRGVLMLESTRRTCFIQHIYTLFSGCRSTNTTAKENTALVRLLRERSHIAHFSPLLAPFGHFIWITGGIWTLLALFDPFWLFWPFLTMFSYASMLIQCKLGALT